METREIIVKLRGIMEERGVKIEELARISGIGQRTLYRRFKGESYFNADEIWKLSQALRIDNIEEIFFT